MPAVDHTYFCECSIYPNGHHVRKTSKMVHSLEIKNYKTKDMTPDIEASNAGAKLSLSPSPEINDTISNVSEVLLGLSISDNQSIGGPVTTQNLIPMDAVQHSLYKVLEDRFQKVTKSTTSTAQSISREGLPTNSQERKHSLLLDAIKNDVNAITSSLGQINNDILADESKMRTLLQRISEKIRASGISLALNFNNPSSIIFERKQLILEDLKNADALVAQLGALFHAEIEPIIPIHINSEKMLSSPVARLDTITQITLLLGAVAHFVMGLSGKSCDFILSVISMVIRMSMALSLPPGDEREECYPTNQSTVLQQLPSTIDQALGFFDLDSDATIYAACPSCNFTHKSIYNRVTTQYAYPTHCTNRILTKDGRQPCGSNLLQESGRDGSNSPLKPFVSTSLKDYLSRVLTDPEAERLCKKACDDAFANIWQPLTESRNIFDSSFIRNFKGPNSNRLFIDRGEVIRLVLAMHVDFFNPNTERRAATKSIGIITLVIMNLPEDLRYKPEFIFPVGIIPGPHEPPLEELNHYIRPIIEELKAGWSPGYHLSNTADSPTHGEHVDVALVLSINDLPAARKVSGSAGVASNIYCTVCDCRDRATMYRTDCEHWKRRDTRSLRRYAEAWRDAGTLTEREHIEAEHGLRWSELWQLPYWDPTHMLVIDSMHCILEGLVHYHCRYVLCLDSAQAKITTQPAFCYPWTQYEDNKIPGFSDKDQKQISSIHNLLEHPIGDDGPDPLNETQLEVRLMRRKKNALNFVADDLKLLNIRIQNDKGVYVLPTTKKHLTKLLVQWRLKFPLVSENFWPKTCDMTTLRYVQHVIKTTETPSWIHSVPLNYGEASAGLIKAGEWRTLSTIYIPIALVTLWGDESIPHQQHFLGLLDHSMALFEAVTLMVKNTMTHARAVRYRTLLRYWVDNLYELHPHTSEHRKRPNVHAAFHIYDFLLLFGPVMSWWAFPFERLIGVLQRINTNDMIGGMLEQTMLKSYTKRANLQRWLRRSDCPEVIRQFKALFDKAFSSHVLHSDSESCPSTTGPLPVEVAHYKYHGVNYSRAKTHMGNSLILYYPTHDSVSPIAGSIQKITTSSIGPRLHVQRQSPLQPGQRDPFARYPFFPCRTYSADMQKMTRLDVIELSSVVTHVARYTFKDRAVILDLSRV